MSWAADTWTEVESRALMSGLTARVGGPVSVLDLDPSHFLQLCEGILRENEGRREALEDLLDSATFLSAVPAPVDLYDRHRDIDRLARLFGG